jgi:heptosyltransferase-1
MIMRVLIIKTSPFADLVHALPVLAFLQQAIPGIEIDWLVEARCADILADNPLVHRLVAVEIEKWRQRLFSLSTWREISVFKADLAASRYDIVFDLQGDLPSGLIAKYTNCSRRYGFDADAVKESVNLRFTTNQVPLRRQDYHETDRCLRVVSVPFGKDYSGLELSATVTTTAEEDQLAALSLTALLDGFVFMFLPVAADPTMQWREQGWIELGRELTGIYPDATVIIPWSGERERLAAETIARGVGQHVKLLEFVSIKSLCALLKKIDLVFGGDVALLHIAAAIGTPTVSFYRATDGKRHGPRGALHRIIEAPLPCAKCLQQACDNNADCLESIKVSDMLAAAGDLLQTP